MSLCRVRTCRHMWNFPIPLKSTPCTCFRPCVERRLEKRRRYASGPNRPSETSSSDTTDDFYNLLLETPIVSAPSSISHSPPVSAASSSSFPSSRGSPTAPTPLISFSTPLAGPSARMRGIARGEKGLDRPPEPENCCMSGCVNCVWDAYREEVEEWAAARRRREREGEQHGSLRARGTEENTEGGVGDLDEVGGRAVDDLDGSGGASLFDGVPVGIREFMATEKRLRERRERGGEGEGLNDLTGSEN